MLASFSKSIYYPAGGTDLQVLLRFSDISDTVISPTLSKNLSIEEYDRRFRCKCQHINSFYGHDVLTYEGYTELDSGFIRNNKFVGYPPGLFSQSEMEQYNNAFSQYFNKRNFVVQFNFIRKIGGIERPVQWIAMNTEGLATLISLCRLTGEEPKMLCTIQSGVMEYPRSLFVRLLDHLKLKTKIWVRGCWTHDDWRYNNRPITDFAPYQYPIQHYGLWFSPMGEEGLENEENITRTQISRVRAFSNVANLRIPAEIEISHPENTGRKIKVIQQDINDIVPENYELIITSRHIFHGDASENLVFWDQLFERPNTHYPSLTLVEGLQKIQELMNTNGISKVAMTPIGFEDEAAYLEHFAASNAGNLQLDIYHIRPLDFLAMKEVQLN